MQEVEHLLKEVSDKLKEFNAANESKRVTERFNVFEALGVGANEKKICRFLWEILSPAKALRNGFLEREFFLKSFVRKVLELDIPDYKLEQAEVYIEYYTQNGRKIDIVIRSKKLFIPIEVKIWAWDLNEQCKDYYEEAKKYDDDAKIFYLTPNGHAPSPESSYGVPAEDMKCISFKNDIYDWISYCIGQPEVIRNAPLREVLLQFAETVKKFTEQQTKEEKLKMEIAKIIRESPENQRAAKSILSAIGTVLQTKLFETVEKMLKEDGYEPVKGRLYYADESCETPGLFYNNNENNSMKPGVFFDVEEWYGYTSAFIGYFTLHGRKWGDFEKGGMNGYYVDFKKVAHLCELCDEENMKKFAGNCAEKIKEYLENINSSQQNA